MLLGGLRITIKRLMATLLFLPLSGCAFLLRTGTEARVPAPHVFRGVFHVHTDFSDDSKASLETVLATARSAELDFVVVTDHNTLAGAEVYRKKKRPDRPLLIFGNEISAPDGHLIALGISKTPPPLATSQELLDWIHKEEGFAVLAHPFCKKNPWQNWDLKGYDGLELYNFGHAFYLENKFLLAIQVLFLAPQDFLRVFEKIPLPYFQAWDEKLRTAKVAAYSAADAHIHWQWLGITPESYLLNFQSVTTYVLSDELTEKDVLQALREGGSFIAFEARGDARNFLFLASSGDRSYGPGASLTQESPISFSVRVPEASEIRLFHNGELIQKSRGKELVSEAKGPGVYRVEVYRNGGLWIFSNPIYVQA